MGCAHSLSGQVGVPTTSDEVASPSQKTENQQAQVQETVAYRNTSSVPSTRSQGQAAEATSSANDSRTNSSPRNRAKQQAAEETSGSPRTVDGVANASTAVLRGDASGGAQPGLPPQPPERPGTPSNSTTTDTPPWTATSFGAGAAHNPTSTLPPLALRPDDSFPPRPLPPQRSPEASGNGAQATLPVLRDLLARISTPQPQPLVNVCKLVLIVWDIENVRCPRGNGSLDPLLAPAKVLGYIKDHFIHEPGRVEYRTVAAVTPKSLGVIHKNYPDFVEQMVPELTLLIASADEPKRNADVMLKKELYRFVSEHSHTARHSPGQLTVVLISGDEDFLEPVQVALNSGFSVELMHHEQPSWALRSQQGYAREPLLWAEFLKQRSGARHVNLPYNNKHNGKQKRGAAGGHDNGP